MRGIFFPHWEGDAIVFPEGCIGSDEVESLLLCPLSLFSPYHALGLWGNVRIAAPFYRGLCRETGVPF
jgi:hypothetical protein